MLYGGPWGNMDLQSAFILSPENGRYDIWIAYDPTYNVAPAVDYEALAEVEYLPKVSPIKRLLPDLTFRSTERITFATPSFPIFEPDPPEGASCFASEVEEDGAQTCLRFDQIVANVGAGPIEIAWQVPTGSVPDDQKERLASINREPFDDRATWLSQSGVEGGSRAADGVRRDTAAMNVTPTHNGDGALLLSLTQHAVEVETCASHQRGAMRELRQNLARLGRELTAVKLGL